MITQGVNRTGSSSAPKSSVLDMSSSQLQKDQFLKLLVTQMKHQDPLDPIKNEDFLGQLAQFSTLDSVQKLNANFSDMLMLQQLGQGSNLIGKTITFEDSAKLERGVVESISVDNGKVQLVVGKHNVGLDQIRGVEK